MKPLDEQRTDRELTHIVGAGLRKCAARPAPSTRYAGWSGPALKAEAIKLVKRTGKSKSWLAREFGVPRETAKDWWDSLNRPRSYPPEEFVEWLACLADAAALVRRAS